MWFEAQNLLRYHAGRNGVNAVDRKENKQTNKQNKQTNKQPKQQTHKTKQVPKAFNNDTQTRVQSNQADRQGAVDTQAGKRATRTHKPTPTGTRASEASEASNARNTTQNTHTNLRAFITHR